MTQLLTFTTAARFLGLVLLPEGVRVDHLDMGGGCRFIRLTLPLELAQPLRFTICRYAVESAGLTAGERRCLSYTRERLTKAERDFYARAQGVTG